MRQELPQAAAALASVAVLLTQRTRLSLREPSAVADGVSWLWLGSLQQLQQLETDCGKVTRGAAQTHLLGHVWCHW